MGTSGNGSRTQTQMVSICVTCVGVGCFENQEKDCDGSPAHGKAMTPSQHPRESEAPGSESVLPSGWCHFTWSEKTASSGRGGASSVARSPYRQRLSEVPT